MDKYLDCKIKYQKNMLNDASDIIKKGGLVLFPTETVYGIGADGLNCDAVSKIFIAKGRKK
jgi:Putative translation factor (SUA5)